MTDPDVQTRAWRQALQRTKSRNLRSRLLIALFQGLANVGHRPRQWLGAVIGFLAPSLIRRRRHVVARNLALCFPTMSPGARRRLLRRHFRELAQTFVDRSVLWFGTRQDVLELVTLEGFEHIRQAQAQGQRIMLLAPHLIGLDAAATRLALEGHEGATVYAPQSNPDVDAVVRLGRSRFGHVHLLSRRAGVRGLIRKIEQGVPIYYLPDMDLGRRGAVFVPFFGVAAATQTAAAQLARQFSMTVIPVLSYRDPRSGRYLIRVLPAMSDFPDEHGTLKEDTALLNRYLERWIEPAPEQYYWVHRRFKSRPPGQASLY